MTPGMPGSTSTHSVKGLVRDSDASPLGNATVRAVERRLRIESVLGEAKTSQDGAYQITYPVNGRDGASSPALVNLVVRVVDGNGKIAVESPILFDAPASATVDLMIGGGIYRGPAEFELLSAKLVAAADGTALSDLTDKDLEYLTNATGEDRDKVAAFIDAQHFLQTFGLHAAIGYALRRQSIPIDPAGLAALSPKVPERALGAAIERNLIRFRKGLTPQGAADEIRKVVSRILLTSPEYANKGIAAVLSTTSLKPEQQQQFLTAFLTHQGSTESFWKSLAGQPAFSSPELREELQFTFQAASLGLGHVPLLQELQRHRRSGDIRSLRDLAPLSESDWVALLTERTPGSGVVVGTPDTVPGTTALDRARNYAHLLARTVADAYPTTAIAARLKTDPGPIEAKDDLVQFFANHPDFDFATGTVASYLKEHTNALAGLSDEKAALKQLKSYERVFRLTPYYEEISALLRDNIHSAQSVVRLGQTIFLNRYADTLGGKARAALVYERAARTASMTVNLLAAYSPAYHGALPSAIPKPFDLLKESIPDLQTLFGSQDFCACQDCRSVLSPAAYLVDLLEFLRKAPIDSNQNSVNPLANKSVKDRLFERRPDLGEIELTCENTNTPVPYVDLVNELLEDAVTPRQFGLSSDLYADPEVHKGIITRALRNAFKDAGFELSQNAQLDITQSGYPIRDNGWRFVMGRKGDGSPPFVTPYPQTAATQAEAAANPEHLHAPAYDVLRQSVFPWSLPFDLWVETARAYLPQLSTTRQELLTTFARDYLQRELAAATERLGLTPFERQLIAGISGHPVAELWGYGPLPPASWMDDIAQVPTFLQHSGLAYTNLIDLLGTQFINAGSKITIVSRDLGNPLTCDTSQLHLAGLTQDALDHAYRFVRLLQKTGFSSADLDLVLQYFGPTFTDARGRFADSFVFAIDALQRVSTRFSLTMSQTLAFWFPISTSGTPSLYASLFQNPEVVNPVDPAFQLLNGDLTGNEKISAHATTVLSALEISSSDLTLLLQHRLEDKLTLPNLSRLYRFALLANSTSLSIADLLRLQDLSGIDPFNLKAPQDTLRFADLVDEISKTGFTLEEIDYLVRAKVGVASLLAPQADAIAILLEELRQGLVKIKVPNASQPVPADPTGQATRDALSKLPSWKDDWVETAMEIIARTSLLSDADQKTFLEQHFGNFADVAEAEAKLLIPITPDSPLSERYQWVLGKLLIAQGTAARQGLIVQKLASALKLELSTLATLLTKKLRSATFGSTFMVEDFLALTAPLQLVGQDNPAFKSYVRLSKVALILARTKMRADQVDWYTTYAPQAGWFDFNTLPDVSQDDPGPRFTAWRRTMALLSLQNKLPGRSSTLGAIFAIAYLPFGSRSAILTELSNRVGWALDQLTAVADSLGLISLESFRDEIGLTQLYEAMALLKRMGVPFTQASLWARAGFVDAQPLTSSIAASMIAAVRAKYDATSWSAAAKPLRDILREKQRAALVSYLLVRPNASAGQQWTDTYGMYQHFLIDVEMSPCQLTSRIKQAISSVQQFVQRARMSLEPGIVATEQVDADWRNWFWMKNYRVWEANRKVFLYPENWIEPSLRDDKSDLFTDLESDLLKNDLTTDRAEDAYIKYLEGLNDIARLEIMGMFHEQTFDKDQHPIIDTQHVFGRTYTGSPRVYYYRRRVDGAYWTPWEKISVDIEGDHLIPVVVNSRLFLYWAIFTQKPIGDQQVTMPASGGKVPPQGCYWEIQLACSEYRHNAWTAKRMSTGVIQFPSSRLYDLQDTTYRDHTQNPQSGPPPALRLFTEFNPSQVTFRSFGNLIDCFYCPDEQKQQPQKVH